MNELLVTLYDCNIGSLYIKDNRSFDFRTNEEAFDRFNLFSSIMSVAVPLTPVYSQSHATRRKNFFDELLPEGRNLTYLAQQARINENDTFNLLAQYGKDIAGALEITPADEGLDDKNPYSTPVNDEQIRYLLEHVATLPLGNALLTGKTSLAGVQTKIVLAKQGSSWHQVHEGFPSTHIIKPRVIEYPTIIYDEAFCMELAIRVGLETPITWLEEFDGLDTLVIERYDRSNAVPHGRIHQEDFNQALGAHANEKYQEVGGKVSLKRIAETLIKFAAIEDVCRLAKSVVFAVAIGNLDMHAKNISLLHLPDESIRLAPAYDMVPLRHQNTDNRLAMAVGGEYIHANITKEILAREFMSWNTSVFDKRNATNHFIEEILLQMREELPLIEIHGEAYSKLRSSLSHYVEQLLNNKRVGSFED